MELSNKFKVDLWADPIGISRQLDVIRYTQWYDMSGYESIDFFMSGMFEGSTHGQTAIQYNDFQIYKATNSSGGGATAITTATGKMSKVGTEITTAAKAKSLFINFTTKLVHTNLGATITVLGKEFFSADPGASVAKAFSGLASAAATVSAESFISVFNTNASLSSWKAEMGVTSTGRAVVMIKPRTETAVGATVYVSAGGSTLVSVGVPGMGGHLGIKTELLRDGYRYVALGMAASASGMTTGVSGSRPVSVFALRARSNDGPIASTGTDIQFSRSLKATQL
jgi:hypothetical protein